MRIGQAVRFVYGLFMGTSTPYLKKRQRYLFPTLLIDRDESFQIFLGGSGICARLKSNDGSLVVNLNQGEAAEKWLSIIEESGGVNSVVLNSMDVDFAGGLAHLSKVTRIYAPSSGRESLENLIPGAELIFLESARKIEFAGESVTLVPIDFGPKPYGLVVYFDSRRTLMLGPAFFNHVHPKLQPGLNIGAWTAGLLDLLVRFPADVVLAAEGDIATAKEVREFTSYLKALADPQTEFSECRKSYDWMEIPGTTSLEENFDLLRKNTSEYITIKPAHL
jgi:hypothetical protein